MKTSKAKKQSSTFLFKEDKDAAASSREDNIERILCQHCRRTTSNGIRCLGICVADNDY